LSALLQGVPKRDAAGGILITLGVAAPAYFHNGIPYEANGRVATQLAVPTHYHQGLPFTASGRLSYTAGAVSHYGSGAAPFDGPDVLMMGGEGVSHYVHGVAYNVSNNIEITEL